MAERDYVRLSCRMEACDGEHKAQGYCLRHYRQWQRGGVKQDATNCAHCGEPFAPSMAGAMYCSKRCKHQAWIARNPDRHGEHRQTSGRKVSAFFAGHCSECGEAFTARRARKYCCSKCEGRARYVSLAPEMRTCPVCSREFVPADAASMQSRHCSPECVQQAKKRLHRIGKSRRRARMRGVHAESVDPIKVFERDRWKCKLCGVKTPRAKRGTYEPDAPELDHILPLAQGGEHTYRNVQCACRSCNGAKGGKPLGQLLLIG